MLMKLGDPAMNQWQSLKNIAKKIPGSRTVARKLGLASKPASPELMPIAHGAEGIAQYDCTIRDELEAGDHVIVLLQLHAVVVHSRGQPLIFHRSEFGRLA